MSQSILPTVPKVTEETRHLPLITRRYYELVEQLVRSGVAKNAHNLFADVFKGSLDPSTIKQARRRGTNPRIDTLEKMALRLHLRLTYFVDRPDYGDELDYREYLRSGGPTRPIPAVLGAFFASPAGRSLDEDERERMVEFDNAFGPISDDVAAMAVMTAFKALGRSATGPQP
jgi:hypothetical protein